MNTSSTRLFILNIIMVTTLNGAGAGTPDDYGVPTLQEKAFKKAILYIVSTRSWPAIWQTPSTLHEQLLINISKVISRLTPYFTTKDFRDIGAHTNKEQAAALQASIIRQIRLDTGKDADEFIDTARASKLTVFFQHHLGPEGTEYRARQKYKQSVYKFSLQELIDAGDTGILGDHNSVLSAIGRYINTLDGLRTIPGIQMNHLRRIDLSGNQIENIPPETFRECTHLQTLKLEHNQIHYIDADFFEGLNELEELYLTGNLIEAISPDPFHLPRLERLSLSDNPLKELEPSTFLELSQLKTLMLGKTKLSKEQKRRVAFTLVPELDQLKTINL